MKNPKHRRTIRTAAAVLLLAVLALVLDVTAGRLARPEREDRAEDCWVGFHVVYEPMPPSMEEVEASPEQYPPEDRSHWVEYGSQGLEVEGLGTVSLPREILVGEYQEETGEYRFPGLEGYNAFLAIRKQENGSEHLSGTSGLNQVSVTFGTERSLTGTIYSGPPEGAGEDWMEREPEYVWRAYNVFQMPDGTVYLDGSGNSYGISSGDMSFSSSQTETSTVNGEEETTSLTVEVKVEEAGRLTGVEVKLFDKEDRRLLERAFSPQEAEEGRVALPAEGAWALVVERYEDGTSKRTVYDAAGPEGQDEILHPLILLDEKGMGRTVDLHLEWEKPAQPE